MSIQSLFAFAFDAVVAPTHYEEVGQQLQSKAADDEPTNIFELGMMFAPWFADATSAYNYAIATGDARYMEFRQQHQSSANARRQFMLGFCAASTHFEAMRNGDLTITVQNGCITWQSWSARRPNPLLPPPVGYSARPNLVGQTLDAAIAAGFWFTR